MLNGLNDGSLNAESESTLIGDEDATEYPVHDNYTPSDARTTSLLGNSRENISSKQSDRQQSSPIPQQSKSGGLVSSVLSSLRVSKEKNDNEPPARKTSDTGPNGLSSTQPLQQQRSAYDMGEIRSELGNVGSSTGSSSHSSYVKLDSNNGSSDAILSQTSGSSSSYASGTARGGADSTVKPDQATRNVPQANLLGDDEEDDDEDEDDFAAELNRDIASTTTRNAPLLGGNDDEDEDNESDEDMENENIRPAARKLPEPLANSNKNATQSPSQPPLAKTQTANLLGEDDDDEWSRFD